MGFMIPNIISLDRKKRPRITIASVNFPAFILLQTVLSIAVGIAVFTVCTILILLINHIGLLDTINNLLGSTMVNFTVNKLIQLSAMFACAVAIARLLFEIILLMIVNASLLMIGGLPLRLYETEQPDENQSNSKKYKNQESTTTLTTRTITSTNIVNNADNTSSQQYNNDALDRSTTPGNNSAIVNNTAGTDYDTDEYKKQQAQSILRGLHDNA
jgi:hypothetical protein